MDFHCMKRKELQALCKKHNLLANGTNADMAERLASHLKKPAAEEPKSKRVRFCLEVIDLTKSEDRRNMRKIEDLRVKKSSMKPGFEKCDLVATSVPARSTRSRTQVKEAEEEVIVVSSSSPVEKRSTRRLVNRESGNLDVSGFSTIQTRSMKRARPLFGEDSTIAEDTTQLSTRGSKRSSIALINLLAEESPMLSKKDTYANEFYVQGTTTSVRQSRARKRGNEDGYAAVAVESVSANRTHYATRSAKRKSIASTNLVAEKSLRPSKLDFRVNEVTEHKKGTVASGNSDGHITRAKILSFGARRIVVEIALQANEGSPVESVGGPNLELNPSSVEESAHPLENARDEPEMFGLTDNGNVPTLFEETYNREKREQVNQQISLADNVRVEEASRIIEEFLVGIGAGSSPQGNLNIINGPVKSLGNANDVHEDASVCDVMGTLVEKTCLSEKKECVDEPEEFMESTPINSPLRTQTSGCYSSKDTKGGSSLFDFDDVGESKTVKRQHLMVENLVEIRQEGSKCNLEQLKNADVLVEGNTTSEDTFCFKNEDKMPIISHCLQDDASRNVEHEKHLDNNTESLEEGQYVEITPFSFSHSKDDASRNVEDEKHQDNTENVEGQYAEIMPKITNNCIYGKGDLVSETEDSVDDTSDELIKSNEDFTEILFRKAGNKVLANENMSMLSCHLQADPENLEDKKYLDFVFVNEEGLVERSVEITDQVKKNNVEVKKDLVLEADAIVIAGEAFAESSDCMAGKNVAKDEDKMPTTSFSSLAVASNTMEKKKELEPFIVNGNDVLEAQHLDIMLGVIQDPVDVKKDSGSELDDIVDVVYDDQVEVDEVSHETFECKSDKDLAKGEDKMPISTFKGVSTMPLNTMNEDGNSSQNWTHGERFEEQETSETVQEEKPEDTETEIGKEQLMADSVLTLRDNLAINEEFEAHKCPSSVVNLLGRLSGDEDDEKENLSIFRQTNNIGLEVCDTENEMKETAETTSNNPVSASVEEGQYMECLPAIASDEHFGAIRGVALEKQSLVSDLCIKHEYQENIRVEELISTEKITDQEGGQIVEGSASASQENLDELGYKENHMVQKVENVNDCSISILDHSTSEPCEFEKENANLIENQLGLDNVAVDSSETAKTTSSYSSDLPVENVVKSQGELNVSEINLFSGDNAGNDDIALTQNRMCGEILEAVGTSGTACADRVEDTNNKLEPQDQNRNAGVPISPFNQIESNDVPQKKIETFVSMPFVGEEAELNGTLSESTPKNKAGKNIMDEINSMLTKMYISSAVNRKGFGPHKIQKTPVRLSTQLQQSGLLKSQMKENRANAKVEQTPNCQVAKSGMKRQALEELQSSKYRRGLLSFR